MPDQMVKVTAFYRLDALSQRAVNRELGLPETPTRKFVDCGELFIYRGWCLLDGDGDLDPMSSGFARIRQHLSNEFTERHPTLSQILEPSNFSRVATLRGWPEFKRLPDIPGLPIPSEESTS